MSNVLQEVTSSEITREHVEQRVRNWTERIEELYGQLAEWLPSNWHARGSSTVQMNEQMMREFEVAPKQLRVLELRGDDGGTARVEPRGLWIVGSNGRLDMLKGEQHFLIVDAAENFAAPDWRVSPISDRRRLDPLTPERLRSILSS